MSEDWSETDQSETSIMKVAYAKNHIIADKKRRNLKNCQIVLPRSTHQEASFEPSFVKFGSVGASEKNLHSKRKLVKVNFLQLSMIDSLQSAARLQNFEEFLSDISQHS